MRVYDLIMRKREGGSLDESEWAFLLAGHQSGDVPDYQVAALLMAVYFRGMDDEETVALTRAMVASGDVLDLSGIDGFKVDKHSTGGVGDKTTLVLAPLLAAAGLPVVKLAGRGLGHTGGTLDKLQAVPGLRVDLTPEEIIRQAGDIGLVIAGQSERIVPADRALYALRDVTATVDSLPLIASSIISKKIAGGADGILLDVKQGSGGFCSTPEQAKELARLLVTVGRSLGKQVTARISRMDEPLGMAVGNALELTEAIQMLRGEGPEDLHTLVITMAADLCQMANARREREQTEKQLERLLSGGQALQKLQQMVERQGGDPQYIENPQRLPRARVKLAVTLERDGWLTSLDAAAVGRLAVQLGAGRARKDDSIDPAAGIVVWFKTGGEIHKGQPVATVHARSLEDAMRVRDRLAELFVLADRPPLEEREPVVEDTVYQ